MVAQSGVVFPASMADILANSVEICFGSFTATSTPLVVVTSPTASVKALATPDAAPSSSKKSKTHPPKPYDIIQGMERVIDMMEETLQIFVTFSKCNPVAKKPFMSRVGEVVITDG
jgi:hypothetical protein